MTLPDGVSVRPTIDLLLRIAKQDGYFDGYDDGFKSCIALVLQDVETLGPLAALRRLAEAHAAAPGFSMGQGQRFAVLDFSPEGDDTDPDDDQGT